MFFVSANVTMSLFNYPAALVDLPDARNCFATGSCCNMMDISNKAQDKNRDIVLIVLAGPYRAIQLFQSCREL